MSKRTTLLALALIVLSGCQQQKTVMIDIPFSPELPQPTPAISEINVDDQIYQEISKQKISVDFKNKRCDEVFELLNSKINQKLVVMWASLKSAGIQRDKTILLKIDNASAGQALQLVLDELSDPFNDCAEPLGWSVEQGIILIATKAYLSEKTILCQYPLNDLVVIPKNQSMPYYGSTVQDGDSVFDDSYYDENESTIPHSELIIRIMDLIRNTIDPEGWRSAGGLSSSMEELKGILFVDTSKNNHRQIAQLLNQLRFQKNISILYQTQLFLLDQPKIADSLEKLIKKTIITDEQAQQVTQAIKYSNAGKIIYLPVQILNDTQEGYATHHNSDSEIVESSVIDSKENKSAIATDMIWGVTCNYQGFIDPKQKNIKLGIIPYIFHTDQSDAKSLTTIWYNRIYITMPLDKTLLIDGGNVMPQIAKALAPKLKLKNPRLLILVKVSILQPQPKPQGK